MPHHVRSAPCATTATVSVPITLIEPADDPVLNGTFRQPSRRAVLTATAGSMAGILGANFLPVGSAYGATAPTPLTDAQLIRTAMHVHGSWDEGQGSWESQFAQADALGLGCSTCRPTTTAPRPTTTCRPWPA